LRNRWDEWYSNEGVCPSFRAVRRAKLARVLRFYAEKANRHCLTKECYQNIVSEIDRMIEKGGEYSFTVAEKPDRGWVFCPEYSGVAPLEVSPADWDTRVFLFGPGLLPDSDFYRQIPVTSAAVGQDHEDIFAKEHAEELDNSTEPSIAPYQSHADICRSAAPEPKLNQVESPTDVANAGSRHESETKNSDSSKAGTDADNGERSVCLGTDLLTGSEVRWPLTVKGILTFWSPVSPEWARRPAS
jgi:DNA phosphorothioation-dependent restriction protein DptH